MRAVVAARKLGDVSGLQEQRRFAEELRSEGRWGELLRREEGAELLACRELALGGRSCC